MNLLPFSVHNQVGKQAIRTLLLSLVFLSVPIESSQACLMQHSYDLLLKKAPKKLNEATFMGKVELIRITHASDKTIVRAIVQESKTHPHFVGKKMMFFYKPLLNLCGSPVIPIRIGSQGFAIGRALNLGSEILYVKPYIHSRGIFGLGEVLTESGSIPESEFY